MTLSAKDEKTYRKHCTHSKTSEPRGKNGVQNPKNDPTNSYAQILSTGTDFNRDDFNITLPPIPNMDIWLKGQDRR